MWHTVSPAPPMSNNKPVKLPPALVSIPIPMLGGIPLTETFFPELFQNHGYYTAAVGKWHLEKSVIYGTEDKQTRDYHDNFTTFSAETQPKTVALITLWDSTLQERHITTCLSLFKNRERVPAKGYISDQLTDEAIGII